MDWFEQAIDPVINQAKTQYPILNTLDIQFKRNHQPDRGYLEFWPEDETGTAQQPRPKEFAHGKIGVEIYNENTRPIDILGDVVSHHLVKTDPTISMYYQKFEESLTDEQKDRLKEQYQHAKTNEGETRPFEQWYASTGLPAYFRGYAFQQWDQPEQLYTPGQRKMFDTMMQHLGRK